MCDKCVHYATYMGVYYIHSKTSRNRMTMGPNLTGPFREVVGLGNWNTVMGDYVGPQ